MTDTEIFDKAVTYRGGTLNTSRLDPHLRGFCDGFKTQAQVRINRIVARRAKPEALPHVHFDIIDNPKVNALAFLSEGKAFIGIYAGTFFVLYDFFCRMLAKPTIFPEIGNIMAENQHLVRLPHLIVSDEELSQLAATGRITRPVFPKDTMRHAYAQLLCEKALSFLLCHQLGHLVNGHIHLTHQITGKSLLPELASNTPARFTPVLRQTLEWDADRWAAHQIADSIKSSINGHSVFPAPYEKFASPYVAELTTWGVAMWVLLRLLGVNNTSASDRAETPYLAPSFRQWNCLLNVQHDLNPWKSRESNEPFDEGIQTPEDNHTLIHDLIFRGEMAISSLVMDENFNASNLRKMLEAPAPANFKMLSQQWKAVVRPLLLPLAPAIELTTE